MSSSQKIILPEKNGGKAPAAPAASVPPMLEPSVFNLVPNENLLAEKNPALVSQGLRHLKQLQRKESVLLLRRFLFHPSEQVQNEARRKLKRLEMGYRRKFFHFQDRMKRYPNYPGFKLGFAVVCLRYAQIWTEDSRLKEYFLRQALKHLNQLIRLFHPREKYFYLRGQVLCELGHLHLALADFDRVLQLRPSHLGARFSLIDLYFRTGRPETALQHLHELRQRPCPRVLRPMLDFFSGETEQ